MSKLLWDRPGERLYETGVDRGVLYLASEGVYDSGVAWNGLTTVTESPDGAAPTPMYADNIKYLNLLSRENFNATVEAMTYPDEFALCDGSAEPVPGVFITQQRRHVFGMAYRTKIGSDEIQDDYGYKIHCIYGALAAPSERAYASINDSPNTVAFSWALSTTEVDVTDLKPTALVIIDSTKVDPTALAAFEDILYGTASTTARLPLPDEIIELIGAPTLTAVVPTAPTYNSSTHVVTVPTVTGVQYRRADTNAVVAPGSTITLTTGQTLVFKAAATAGYKLAPNADDDFSVAY